VRWNNSRECRNFIYACQNDTACKNLTLHVKITLCVWKSHSVCINHTRTSCNHTLRSEITLVLGTIILFVWTLHYVCWNHTRAVCSKNWLLYNCWPFFCSFSIKLYYPHPHPLPSSMYHACPTISNSGSKKKVLNKLRQCTENGERKPRRSRNFKINPATMFHFEQCWNIHKFFFQLISGINFLLK
jgi:hypothetical protein